MEEIPSDEKLIDSLKKQREAVFACLINKSIEFQAIKILLNHINQDIAKNEELLNNQTEQKKSQEIISRENLKKLKSQKVKKK